MNIDNVSTDRVPQTESMLVQIFAQQKELMAKSGIIAPVPRHLNIHDSRGQARLKDMAWCVTEELAKSYEAHQLGRQNHCKEELGDALHFFVALCILAGFTPDDLVNEPGDEDLLIKVFRKASRFQQAHTEAFGDLFADVVLSLGLAMNCLKNRSWKSTQMLTDVELFKEHIRDAFQAYVFLCVGNGLRPITLFDVYFRKSVVNSFRQRTLTPRT